MSRALRLGKGTLSRKELWVVNARYFRGQGANFAGMLAQLTGAAGMAAGEMDYLFEKDIIFSGPHITAVNRDYELRLSLCESVRVAGWLAWGLLRRRLSARSMKELLNSLLAAESIARHYRAFPAGPGGFEEWREKADSLWARARAG